MVNVVLPRKPPVGITNKPSAKAVLMSSNRPITVSGEVALPSPSTVKAVALGNFNLPFAKLRVTRKMLSDFASMSVTNNRFRLAADKTNGTIFVVTGSGK